MIYLLIAFFATSLGALVGLGGGVIIKPVLVAISPYDLFSISMLSSLAVFSMSLLTTLIKVHEGVSLDKRVVLIGVGSVAGGFLGKALLNNFIAATSPSVATFLQSSLLALLMVGVLWLTLRKGKTHHLQHPLFVVLCGLTLGVISTFLGIGGGPINVALFTFLFSFSLDKAIVYSLFLILLSQGTMLFLTLLSGGFGSADLTMAPFVIIGGVGGALCGRFFTKKLGKESKRLAFIISIFCIIGLNLFNAVASL